MRRILLIVGAEARRQAPVRTGHLRRAHTEHVEQGGNRGRVGVAGVVYARPVHEGRGEVIIRPKRKKALYGKGMRHPVKFVRQPPRKGNPWLVRAAQVSRPAVDREAAGYANVQLGKVGR